VDLIDKENWSAAGVDIKDDAYEELLSKGAEDIKSGAGQYFTPRALIQAIVGCIDPGPADTVVDPAAGTGGFLLVAHEHASRDAENLNPDQRSHLRDGFVRGMELVDGTARLAAMNLLLHGIGTPNGPSLIDVKDSLIADPGERWSVVLSNPPFGRKSSITTAVPMAGRRARTGRSSVPTSWSPPRTSSSTSCSTSRRSSTSTAAQRSSYRPTCSSRVVSGRRCGGGCSPTSTCTRCCGCRRGSSTPRA